jgi:hypothetical protein
MSLEANLIKFIKETIVELACNNFINHIEYDKIKRESNLKNKMIKNNYNFESSIKEVVKEILVDKKIMNKVNFFTKKNYIEAKPQFKLIRWIKYLYNKDYYDDLEEENCFDDLDEEKSFYENDQYKLRNDLFENFIIFVGLNELLNLNVNDKKNFQDKFFKAINLI